MPLIRRLPGIFSILKVSLLAWRETGIGLWPINDWHEDRLTRYLGELYEATQKQLAEQLRREVTLPLWNACLPADVSGGPDLSLLFSLLLNTFPPDRCCEESVLLEQIQWALIALVYPEEPGELTVEEVLERA
ncbi:hypothetical protein [Mucilaginibacter sp.]|uniref:hypothetical protein n=1 Tax=Mucilaginibacter sp. TaxID=1882438 RepID=UPI002615EC56|nr:hypothetical protein [Mucilaginibacter sp.]